MRNIICLWELLLCLITLLLLISSILGLLSSNLAGGIILTLILGGYSPIGLHLALRSTISSPITFRLLKFFQVLIDRAEVGFERLRHRAQKISKAALSSKLIGNRPKRRMLVLPFRQRRLGLNLLLKLFLFLTVFNQFLQKALLLTLRNGVILLGNINIKLKSGRLHLLLSFLELVGDHLIQIRIIKHGLETLQLLLGLFEFFHCHLKITGLTRSLLSTARRQCRRIILLLFAILYNRWMLVLSIGFITRLIILHPHYHAVSLFPRLRLLCSCC